MKHGRGNGRGNAFRFTSGGCPCCWYKTVVIFSRERRYCTVLLLKKNKKQSNKSEQMLLVSSHGHCCSVWSLWQAPFCLMLLCVKVVKMTGSVLSQTRSEDVKMECFSSCLPRFFYCYFLLLCNVQVCTHTDAVGDNVWSQFLHRPLSVLWSTMSSYPTDSREEQKLRQSMATGPVQSSRTALTVFLRGLEGHRYAANLCLSKTSTFINQAGLGTFWWRLLSLYRWLIRKQ